jgi:hypothetical protein
MNQQLDLMAALAERDLALDKVSDRAGPWIDRAMRGLAALPLGWQGTGESIRLALPVEPPHHHNAWGAVIKKALDRGLLTPTGKFEHMRTKKSHARKTPVYRRGA